MVSFVLESVFFKTEESINHLNFLWEISRAEVTLEDPLVFVDITRSSFSRTIALLFEVLEDVCHELKGNDEYEEYIRKRYEELGGKVSSALENFK